MSGELTQRVPHERVQQAVEALLAWDRSRRRGEAPESSTAANEKASLFDEDEFVYLTLAMFKVPAQPRTKPIRVPLPHGIYGESICLICKDPADDLKAQLEHEPVQGVEKVLSVSKLRKNYRQYTDRRELCRRYELFLADDRVLPLMPGLLGKQFFNKKKHPAPVCLSRKTWRFDVAKARDSTFVFLGHGPCISVKVARSTFKSKQIAENVAAAIAGAVNALPRGWMNVQGIYLKMQNSTSLPLYQANPPAPKPASSES